MTGAEIVQAIVEILASGITSLGSAIGTGVQTCVTALFFSGTGESQVLSAFAVVTLVFAGVSLCIALTTKIFTWLQNLGN